MTLQELAFTETILLAAVSAALTLLYLFSKIIRNAGIVDVFWAASFGVIALVFAAVCPGLLERKLVLLLTVLPWSLRMTIHLLVRFLKEYPHEDKRYASLREQWGERADLTMYLVFLFQGALITILSPPFLLVAANTNEGIGSAEIVGAAICLIGTFGEAIADDELRKFKNNPDNKGKVCSYGLWNYSRHPNYFFEFVVWVGIYVLAASSPFGIFTFYCPVIMLYLLTQMTGIKISEEQSLKSRGEEYRRYQQTTSAFFPWIKKSS
ncbi:MAG: DUF1295 domain-containing protein [Candidatus Melainabacteria bacterium]|nr:DUF1295 domain-containing protein [Candidatus Melainabacteria bacterium]